MKESATPTKTEKTYDHARKAAPVEMDYLSIFFSCFFLCVKKVNIELWLPYKRISQSWPFPVIMRKTLSWLLAHASFVYILQSTEPLDAIWIVLLKS